MPKVTEPLLTTDLPLPNRREGKVRDIYDCPLPDGSDGLLLIATDRISAFDVVMSNGIPGKGVILTQISRFWFEHFADLAPHHLVSTDPADIPGLSDQQRRQLEGRIMLGRKTQVVPIECVARGYITGSGFKDYQKTGKVCGVELPPGLVNSDKLEDPIFTPATKAEVGHDENITFEQAADIAGTELMTKLRDLTLTVYRQAREFAEQRGIIIADTKLEFGHNDAGDLLVVDELLTPDSSRFWPAAEYHPGREQNSLDKQYVRNYLQELVDRGEWDKTPPGPSLPDDVVQNTLERYKQAYRQLTGEEIDL